MNEYELPLVECGNETLEIRFKTAKGVLGKRLVGMTSDDIDKLTSKLLEEDELLLELLR